MSAQVLRKAATTIREEWGGDMGAWNRTQAFHLAVADWLDGVAYDREVIDGIAHQRGEPPGSGSQLFLAVERHALAVARAYLGSES